LALLRRPQHWFVNATNGKDARGRLSALRVTQRAVSRCPMRSYMCGYRPCLTSLASAQSVCLPLDTQTCSEQILVGKASLRVWHSCCFYGLCRALAQRVVRHLRGCALRGTQQVSCRRQGAGPVTGYELVENCSKQLWQVSKQSAMESQC
jgi:hypothetical protein